MDKREHAARLRVAMAEGGYSRRVIADLTGHQPRTVTNWTTGATMPGDAERALLRKLLGPYDTPGDPMETALEHCELIDWRRDAVRSTYRRHLSEQRDSAAS